MGASWGPLASCSPRARLVLASCSPRARRTSGEGAPWEPGGRHVGVMGCDVLACVCMWKKRVGVQDLRGSAERRSRASLLYLYL